MMRRMMTTVAAASMLLVAVFGGTAVAQDIEGFQSDTQCAISIAAFYEENYPEFWADEFEGLEGQALTDAVADWLAENDLVFADLCAIYASGNLPEPPEVLPEIVPEPEPEPEVTPEPEPEPEPEPIPEPEPEQVTPEVMGVTIARTGADTLILGVIGAILMGLGVLAVRRTRTEHGVG